VRALPWLLSLIALPAWANDRWGGSVALTSDYRLRGVSQSDGSPAVQADAHYNSPGGWLAGLWASSVKLYSQETTTAEINAFVGGGWALNRDWSAKVLVSHYAYAGNRQASRYDYDDLTAGAAWRDRLFFSATWAPNSSLVSSRGIRWNRSALTYDVTARVPVTARLSGVAGVGYYDLSELVGIGYWYGSAGLVYDLPRLHFDVSRVQNSAAARDSFYGAVADNRWTATVIWTF